MSIKVLLVDDSPIITGYLQSALRIDKEIEVVGKASNGKEGIEKIKELKPDVVLLDIEMPVMDGFAAMEEIQKLKEAGEVSNKIKIIMLSGLLYNNEDEQKKAQFLGAYATLAKPEGKSSSLLVSKELKNIIAKIREAAGK